MHFGQDDRLLFIGDSITDTGRDRADDTSLGDGYVRMIADALSAAAPTGQPPATVINKGLDGNRVYDLEARWTADVIDAAPSVVTVMIGVNDTWRRFDRGLTSPVPEFEASLDRVLTLTVAQCSPRLFMITPFLLTVTPEQDAWHDDLSPRVDAVLRAAGNHGATVVRADLALPRAAEEHGAAVLAPDGVHPSALGHRIIAQAWLTAAAR